MAKTIITTEEGLQQIVKQLHAEIVDKIKDANKQNFKNAVQRVYNEIKSEYEKVQLLNEDGNTIVKNIDTALVFQEDQKDTNVELTAEIVTSSPIEKDILYAQSHGTGMGVKQEILDEFKVEQEYIKDDDGNDTEVSKWYFNPDGMNKIILGKLNQIFKTYMRR